MEGIRRLDENERKIVKELIKNPRISDNQISKNTKVPVMTVNRKRKQLEEERLLHYFTSFDTGEFGTGTFKAKQLYIIKFKTGITRSQFIEKVEKDKRFQAFNASYISLSYLGEKDGRLALIMVLDAETDSSLVDEFSGKIVPHLKENLGEECIAELITTKIINTLRRHHNYLPSINMEKGVMKKDWPDDWIFVDKIVE
ncbi:MAG: winged helix-turn-helix domain-containing protein [Nanoarchaeota archaeon]|nr:winged helix-turn-helix domain-containing protein [Nanoarchaeota archaeon]